MFLVLWMCFPIIPDKNKQTVNYLRDCPIPSCKTETLPSDIEPYPMWVTIPKLKDWALELIMLIVP